uniref:uncharacterized protein LOC120956181 n=1 Tax=Anopheles coluzzii TaxID=1518534 RepID=UPI0020FFCE5B|nr:uncharacterized protein LOC120956181 [Anopheles coluzzii]
MKKASASLPRCKSTVCFGRKKNYKNVVLKGDAWAAIAAKEEVSPQDAKHLWSRLLGIYRTNKAKIKKTTQTGASNDDVFRPRWFAYHAMSFVDEATQDAVHVDTLGYDDEGLTLRPLVEAAYAVPQSLDDIDWDAAVAFDPEPFSPTPSSYPSALSVTPGTIREGNGVSGALNNRLQQPVSGATGAPETADLDDFGRWKRLLRATAYVHRFRQNCQRKAKGLPIMSEKATNSQACRIKRHVLPDEQPISTEEYLKAEQTLWRMAQKDAFDKEMKDVGNKGEVDRSSPLYAATPILDEQGVLRVDGRTAKANFASYDTRFPVILPNQHPITNLLILDYHSRYGHANRETVVNEIRQRFHIPHLRAAVDRSARNCQRCKIKKCQPKNPRMAPLPAERLTTHVRAFSNTGIDYLGPLDVVNGRRKEKRYVAVFTCLVTRAVHLEVAHSLSTTACIMAIRRFIGRRGPPAEIWSDNGTNFNGASNELNRQLADTHYSCADTFTNANTRWNFNPPSATHMGGVWERMVRSVKEGMSALDDGRTINDETLLTTLAEVEFLINTRPLVYQPQVSDSEALTPNHFLLRHSSGLKQHMRSCPDLSDALKSSYQRSMVLADGILERWLMEYFPTLNRRTKWRAENPSLRVGDLVFIAEGHRKDWTRAQVEEVFTGSDGKVRQAIVRTAQCKRVKRPVAKLAKLPVEVESRS